MRKLHGAKIIFIQAAERRVQADVQPCGQCVLDAVHGVGVTVHADQLIVCGFIGRIERNLHCVQAGGAQLLAHGAGQHAAVGVQARYKPLRGLHQLYQIVPQGRLAAGKGQLRNADAAAFFDDRQPLVGVQLGHGGKRLIGGVAVQAFLIAMPRVVLYHRGDHQVHAVRRGHAGRVFGQRKGLDVQRRLLAARHGDEAVQHHLQVGFDLQRLGLTINFARCGHGLRVDGRPVGVFQLGTGVGLQRFDEVGQQNGPAQIQRQDVLAVQDGYKRGGAVGLGTRDQVDAHDARPVGVKRNVPHAVQMAAQERPLAVGEMLHRGFPPKTDSRLL